jgi:hypothetical protein
LINLVTTHFHFRSWSVTSSLGRLAAGSGTLCCVEQTGCPSFIGPDPSAGHDDSLTFNIKAFHYFVKHFLLSIILKKALDEAWQLSENKESHSSSPI